jgi:hypothetical protein
MNPDAVMIAEELGRVAPHLGTLAAHIAAGRCGPDCWCRAFSGRAGTP